MSDAARQLPSLLVIEDEVQIRRLLRGYLERNGFNIIEAANGEAGLSSALSYQPQLILLDLRLPDMDGLEVLKRLREWSQAPVIVISVRSREADKIAALNGGANDYLTKPFGTGELLARVRVALRSAKPMNKPELFRSGPLSVDLPTRTVTVQDRTVRLTPTEYSLLLFFVQHAGKVLTHDQILREVWGEEKLDELQTLRVYMWHLRKKLEPNPEKAELLITEPGVGYRLMVRD
ncbi:MAG TPA: response regulator transcription factor [Verrucomicrobiae bacterium]|jgi:two-component system KDP operon response regulator KdpE|nr:response regulator transcription factor [Verrucomicrobiae bacterium]